MSSAYKFLLLGNVVLLSFAACGQQYTNLPLGALPMQYNGSFAGETGSPRVNANFGFGFGGGHRIGGYYRGVYEQQVSYDQFIPALRSGIGVGVLTNQTSYLLDKHNGQGFSVAVAPKISLNGKYTLSPSLSLEYVGVHKPTYNVMYNDTLRVSYGYDSQSWIGRAGFLFNTSTFYAGYSVDILDNWNYSSDNGWKRSRRLERYSSYLQLGYTYRSSPESPFSITAQVAFYIGHGGFVYRNTGDRFGIHWFQGYNLTFRRKQFLWGFNNMGLHAGWQHRRVKLMATNAISFEGGFSWHHAANLSLRYVFRDEER